MNSRTHIQSELKQMNSSLPFDVKMPVFDVPESYFEGFADAVLAKIKGQQAVSVTDELESITPLLAGIPRNMPYSVPDNYFNNVIQNLPQLTQEEDELPKMLAGAQKMPYEVPSGYFEQLPQQVLGRVAPPKAKIVSLSRSWMRYAVAAVLIGIVAVSSILYFSGGKVDPVQQTEQWLAKKLKNVSNQELEEFINTVSINGTETAKREGTAKPEVRMLLKDVSDSELDAFLSGIPADNSDDEMIIN